MKKGAKLTRKPSTRSAKSSPPQPATAAAKRLPNAHNQNRHSAKSDTDLFPIVGIGASAGGLEAFTRLIEHLPAETGMAFVLVQHLDPEHESKLPQLLAKVTTMPVREVRNNTTVEANHIYVIPPNRSMTIEQRVLKLLARATADGRDRLIDHFLESLASDQGNQAIGVILSGTASDGTLGLQAIKGEGGITFAQDESAKYDSMPRSAIAAGGVDFILSPEKIAAELARIAEHPYVAPTEKATRTTREDSALKDGEEDALDKILSVLRSHTGVDFSLYRGNTIHRRIMRRLVLAKVKTLDAYAHHLRGNAKELEALYQDILIAVTNFFRNPETFETLKHKVFPKLTKDRSPDDAVRVWTVGCSTGQEAYSIAMSFLEYSSQLSQKVKLQVFATDINDALLEKARLGLYSKSLVEDVSSERLRRFFVEEADGYRVSKTIREMCVFARQDVITDPPFSRMDVISCRNLLIYIEPEIQRKLLPTFHYALNGEGFLILGLSESIGQFADWFAPVDKKLKIFRKKPVKAHQHPHVPLAQTKAPAKVIPNKSQMAEPREPVSPGLTAQREADRLALARYGPPGVVINASLEIMQFRGDTSPFLAPPRGRASFNLLKMAREGLMLPLRSAINEAKKKNQRVRKEGVHVNQDGSSRKIHLEVIPLRNIKDPCLLVVFEPAEAPATKGSIRSAKRKHPSKREREQESREVARLTQELVETRHYLQAIQEQYDAANEELQASGEEMQSANEELQSVNEELETSKEELESSNEELITVNEELAHRNAELIRLNDDIINLQSNINLAVLLLGRDFSIRRFTPPAEKIFNLMTNDLGRSITGVRHNLDLSNLEEIIAEVIANVAAQEHEVRDKKGRWFLLRVRPYMTIDNKIDGAVLLLVDITVQKQAEEARARLAAIVESSDDAIISKDLNGIIRTWNQGAEKLFGYTAKEVIGKPVSILIPPDRIDEEPGILERIRRGEKIDHYETIRRRKDGTLRDISLTISPLFDAKGEITGASKIARDITARKRNEQEIAALLASEQNARAEAESANRVKDEFLAIVSHEVRTPLNAIAGWVQMLRSGKLNDEQIAKALETIDRNAASQEQIIAELLDTSRIVSGNLRLDAKAITLPSVIEAAIEILRPAAEAKSIQIETSFDPNVKPIWGDSARLQQVLWNLLSNAVKFTNKGGHVGVTLARRDSNVEVVVQDNGEGISPEFLPFVFERFRQADSTSSRAYGGLGLGLSIVRNIIEMHGGSVRAESEGKGRGATFTVRLPIMVSAPRSADAGRTQTKPLTSDPTQVRIDGIRVLVVDDDSDTRELLGVAFTNSGAEVRTCTSSAEALATLKKWQPDCIVSDIGMPGEDGYDLMEKIRALDKKDGGSIPAIALTGFAGRADQARAAAAGYQLHISKPVELSNLNAEIARLVQKSSR